MENKTENKVKISEVTKTFIEPSKEDPSQLDEINASLEASPEQKEALTDALKRVDKNIILKTTGGQAFEKTNKSNKNIRDEVRGIATSPSREVTSTREVDTNPVKQNSDREIG